MVTVVKTLVLCRPWFLGGLGVLWAWFLLAGFAVADSLNLNSNHFRINLQAHWYALEDPDGAMSRAQAQAQFQAQSFSPPGSFRTQLGYTGSAYWLALPLSKTFTQPLSTVLEVRYPPLDHISVYLLDAQGELLSEQHGGDAQSYATRSLKTRLHSFPLDLSGSEDLLLLVRVRSDSSMLLPIFLSSDSGFIEYDHYAQLALGLFYGIALGLFAYNLFLFIVIRDFIYLHYLAYVLMHTLFMASLDGLLVSLWPDQIGWENRSIYLFAWCSGITLIHFCRRFLHTREDLPRLDRGLLCFQVLFVVSVVLLIWLPIPLAARINGPLVLAAVLFLLGVTVYRYLQGYKPASYFIVGMGAFLFGAGSIALGSMNVFGSYELAPILGKSGAAIELVFFSIGLGHRITTLKAQQQQALQDAAIARAEAHTREEQAEHMAEINRQLEAAMRARSDFLANMSHEIRTPMNGVLGMLELVKETPLNQEQQDYLDVAYRSGATLLALINDILDLSKIESGKLELEQLDFSVVQLLSDLQSLFQVPIQDKGLQFNVEIESTVPAWVKADRTRLWQVLTNLVGNAIKFTREGSVRVRVSCESDGMLRFDVRDTGIGISVQAQEKIFECFTQADSSTTRQFGGTGLGLTISRRLAELMGGELTVQSQLGKGSVFSLVVEMPVGSAPAHARQMVTDEGVVQERLDGVKVLLAEDNPVNQQVARGMLRKLGAELVVASNGAEAVTCASQQAFDVILMDVQMPEMDGYQATVELKAMTGPNQQTPIIAMTANAMEGDRERCLAAGMDDYLAKPIQKELLRQMLLKWVGVAKAA